MQQTLQELPLTLAYIAADLAAITLLVGALYIPRHGRRDLVAAYIGVNVGVLAVTLLLSTSNDVGAGLGLGLFGVLSIIRLRSSSLAQGEVAYFFAALALGLLGGIQSHFIIVIILMVLIIGSLWVGDHPALMRHNRNQTVTIDRAISNESELTRELEDLLGAKVRSIDLKSLDLVNDTTIVEVHYRLHRQSREATPVPQQQVASQQAPQPSQGIARQAPPSPQEAPLQPAAQVLESGQHAWPGTASHDSAASAATAPPRYAWVTGDQQQAQSSTPPPPTVHPRYS